MENYDHLNNFRMEKQKTAKEIRLENEKRMAEKFIANGYITSYELYEDSRGFESRKIKEKYHALHEDLRMLFNIVSGPVLRDGIEDNDGVKMLSDKINERTIIRNKIANSSSTEESVFYERNVLQSSNLAFALTLVNMIRHLLSGQVEIDIEKFNALAKELNGGDDPENLVAFRYKQNLNNHEKRECQKRIIAFVEDFLKQFYE